MEIQIPILDNKKFCLQLKLGEENIFIGANGAGKTRLSVYIKNQLQKIKSDYDSAILGQKKCNEEIKIWKEKDIKNEFLRHSKKFLDNGNKISFHSAVEMLLKQGAYTDFTRNTFAEGILLTPIQSLDNISGGTMQTTRNDIPDELKIIDIDLFKYSEKYFLAKNKNKAIENYKNYKIKLQEEALKEHNLLIKSHENCIIDKVIRVSAHRQLTLNTKLAPKDSKTAIDQLQNSNQNSNSQEITKIQNDFDNLIIALYSENAEISTKAIQDLRDGLIKNIKEAPDSTLNDLVIFWNEILPNRFLKIDGSSLIVFNKSSNNENSYSPSDMSDGERNIFYILGQCLLASKNSLLIIDEPELHIHKSIMGKFWDFVKEKRKDCCFLFITHDVDFVVSSINANKYFIQNYKHENQWEIIENISEDDILEEIKIKLLGSRKNIIFVEGNKNSLDIKVYEKAYSDFLIIPVSSCKEVKKYVNAFSGNIGLHHLKCYGIIDKDRLNNEKIKELQKNNIYTLKVSEIENIFLVESVVMELFKVRQPEKTFNKKEYIELIFKYVYTYKADNTLEITKSKIQKKVQEKINNYESGNIDFSNINAKEIQKSIGDDMGGIISEKNLNKLLMIYQNKGLYQNLKKPELLNCQDLNTELINLMNNPAILKSIKKELPNICLDTNEAKNN